MFDIRKGSRESHAVMLSRHLRLVRLVSIARLRRLGWAPWLLLSGWLVWAALQEPELLRRSDTYLLEGAAWWGGIAMLVSFTCSEAAISAGAGTRLFSNLVAAVACALLMVVLLFGFDLATGSLTDRYVALWARMCGSFALLAWAVAALQRMSQSYYWYTFAALQVMVFLGLTVTLAEAPLGSSLALAGSMAALASVALTLRDPNDKYAEAK